MVKLEEVGLNPGLYRSEAVCSKGGGWGDVYGRNIKLDVTSIVMEVETIYELYIQREECKG